jgi:hypothetical protein
MNISRIKSFFGYAYIVNHNSKEIHKIKSLTKNCKIKLMKNAEQITLSTSKWLLYNGYSKCKHCWPLVKPASIFDQQIDKKYLDSTGFTLD